MPGLLTKYLSPLFPQARENGHMLPAAHLRCKCSKQSTIRLTILSNMVMLL
jgi:hypothetical protein